MLASFSEISYFTTTRENGFSQGNYASLNLSEFSGDDLDTVNKNRQILCDKLGVSPKMLYVPYQTHSDKIAVIDKEFLQLTEQDKLLKLNGVDAIVTNIPQICIGVTTADCVPILLYDPIQKVVAAVHAGWRGTVVRIVAKTAQLMMSNFGSNPHSIVAHIGPSIGAKAYEVGEEVAHQFRLAGLENALILTSEKPHIDLWKANRHSLIEVGLLPENISTANICTYTEHETYFSARRLGVESGRMVSGILMK